MIATRKSIDGFAAGTMLLLCAIWGAQQVAIKLAAPDVAPIMQVALRSGLSALLVAGLMVWRRERIPWRRTARPGLLAGALFAAEFLFIAEGLRRTSASHMAVFLYTSPVFTALGLNFLAPAERLRRHQWLGILVAFAGIALAFMGGTARGGLTMATLGGDLFGILAGAAWGATTVVIRALGAVGGTTHPDAPLPARGGVRALARGRLRVGPGRARFPHAGGLGEPPVPGRRRLVRELSHLVLAPAPLPRDPLSVFSFMTPIFGVTFGVLVLRDPISPSFGGGAALVLAGITIVSGGGLLRPR